MNLIQLVQGYITPEVSTYLVTAIAGVVISCGVAIGIFRRKIALFFRTIKLNRLEKKLAKKAADTDGK